ncbi:MAG TPA: GFA family protein [Steroidobacteraceae bacterium]|nr:GFA family protein [Steroidobacteraceae bacterium]
MEYTARCHCGRIRFSFHTPAITTAARCNCSLCLRRGAVLSSVYIPAKDFTPHDNLGDLGIYRWNEDVLNNYFCKVCGIFTYIGDGEDDKDGYRVNLGCVDGIDLLALDIRIIDGKSLPVIGDGTP